MILFCDQSDILIDFNSSERGQAKGKCRIQSHKED